MNLIGYEEGKVYAYMHMQTHMSINIYTIPITFLKNRKPHFLTSLRAASLTLKSLYLRAVIEAMPVWLSPIRYVSSTERPG